MEVQSSCMSMYISLHIIYVFKCHLYKPINCCQLCFYLACSLTCQNGGTLNVSSCKCDCADGFSGSSCESELKLFELALLILLIHTWTWKSI